MLPRACGVCLQRTSALYRTVTSCRVSLACTTEKAVELHSLQCLLHFTFPSLTDRAWFTLFFLLKFPVVVNHTTTHDTAAPGSAGRVRVRVHQHALTLIPSTSTAWVTHRALTVSVQGTSLTDSASSCSSLLNQFHRDNSCNSNSKQQQQLEHLCSFPICVPRV